MDHELLRALPAHLAALRLDGDRVELDALEDLPVGRAHELVLLAQALAVDVEAVAVLHHELAAAQQPVPGPELVAVLETELEEVERQLPVRPHEAADEVGHDLLGSRREAVVPPVPVLQRDHQVVALVLVPAARLVPERSRLEERQPELVRARRRELLARDRLDLQEDAREERADRVDPGRDLLHEPRAREQRVADRDLAFGRGALDREDGLGEPHLPSLARPA